MEKQRWEESGKRREEERRSEKIKTQKKEDAGARKGRKAAKHCVFQAVCGSRGSKSRLAKVADAGPSGQMRDEKLHAVVVRSKFRSQNVQNTSTPEQKRTKNTNFGPLSEDLMFKKCTAENANHAQTTFGRSTAPRDTTTKTTKTNTTTTTTTAAAATATATATTTIATTATTTTTTTTTPPAAAAAAAAAAPPTTATTTTTTTTTTTKTTTTTRRTTTTTTSTASPAPLHYAPLHHFMLPLPLHNYRTG